jgi:drug/metabolite transporter (DMT)-like permease
VGRRTARWVTGVVSGIVAVLGGVQVFHGQSLGWAAVASAVLMFAGLALMVRGIAWGQLLSSWALVTALTWLFSLLLGVLGRVDDFVFGGWGAGIGVAIATFWQEYSQEQAQHPRTKPARHRAGHTPGGAGPRS